MMIINDSCLQTLYPGMFLVLERNLTACTLACFECQWIRSFQSVVSRTDSFIPTFPPVAYMLLWLGERLLSQACHLKSKTLTALFFIMNTVGSERFFIKTKGLLENAEKSYHSSKGTGK